MRLILYVLCLATALASTPASAAGNQAKFDKAFQTYSDLSAKAQHGEALKHIRTAYSECRKLYGKNSQETGRLAARYARTLSLTGNQKKAEKYQREAIAILEPHFGATSVKVLRLYLDLGALQSQIPKPDAVRVSFQAVDRLLAANTVVKGVPLANVLLAMAMAARQDDDPAYALSFARRGLTALARVTASDPQLMSSLEREVGYGLIRMGNLAEAEQKLEKIIFRENSREEPDFCLINDVRRQLIQAFMQNDDAATATRHEAAFKAQELYRLESHLGPLVVYPPRYPREAMSRGIEGGAVVEFTVATDGTTKNIRVIALEGHKSFGREAVKAAAKYKYRPKTKNGEPVETRCVTYTINFNLAN